jgi:CRP-like cAMP-binding protein
MTSVAAPAAQPGFAPRKLPYAPDYRSILSDVCRSISLSESEKNVFLSLLRPLRVRKRQYIGHQGTINNYETFVSKGCFRAFYLNEQGKEYVVQFAEENAWIGDLGSFITQTSADYYIEALEDSEIFQIEYKDLEELYQRIPQFNTFFRMLFQRAFIAMQQRLVSAYSRSAEERYAEFRRCYPTIEQRVPQYMIALYLGCTPEFLSKIRQQGSRKK